MSLFTLPRTTPLLVESGPHQGLFNWFRQSAQERRQRRASAAADQQFWQAALADPRIMADVTRANSQQAAEVRKARMLRML